MASLISSAYQKLIRAKAHRDALTAMDRKIVYAKYRIVPETTDNPDEIQFRLHLPKLPEQCPMVVADCLHNLRCALDHLVSQLADHESPDRTPGDRRKNQFPICRSSDEFREQMARGRLNGLTPRAVDLVASLQPFAAGFESLSILAELENQDKHQSIMIVGSVARSIFSKTFEAHGVRLPFRTWADHVWDGQVFLRLHRQWASQGFDELIQESIEADGTMQILFLEGSAAGWNVEALHEPGRREDPSCFSPDVLRKGRLTRHAADSGACENERRCG